MRRVISFVIAFTCLILSACSHSDKSTHSEETSLSIESVSETLPFDFPLPDGYTLQYKSSEEVSIVLDNQIIGGIIDTGLEASCITDGESGETNAFVSSLASPPIRIQYFANVWDNKLYVSLTLENFETGEQQEQSHCLFDSESECFDIWVDRALVDDEDRDFLFKTVTSQSILTP